MNKSKEDLTSSGGGNGKRFPKPTLEERIADIKGAAEIMGLVSAVIPTENGIKSVMAKTEEEAEMLGAQVLTQNDNAIDIRRAERRESQQLVSSWKTLADLVEKKKRKGP